jgi:hypothetical protein
LPVNQDLFHFPILHPAHKPYGLCGNIIFNHEQLFLDTVPLRRNRMH